MKNLIYLALLCPMLLIGAHFEEDVPTSPDQTARETQATDIIKQRQEARQRIQQQRDLEDAQAEDAFQRQLASVRTGTAGENSEQPKPTIKINFGEYARQEALLKAQREQDDKRLKTQWQREDKAADEVRNKEGFWTRVTHALSSDSAADSEKEQTRNKTILDLNRERIFEDFARKAKRFETFKEAHPEFSKTPPWDSLLELGDMNKFLDMSPEERTAFTTKIDETVRQLLSDDTVFESKDFDALTDLIRLTRLHDLGEADLPNDFQQRFQTTFTAEFSSKTPEEQREISEQLKNLLKESLKDSVQMLQNFNDAMEDVKADINTLETLRTIKNVGNAAFWVLGTVAGVLMLSHGVIVIKGVQLTMEKFAIGAKIGILAGHTAAHSEAELSKALQTKFQKIFSPLLPKTTALIDITSYKSNAKSLGQRIKDSVTSVKNKIVNHPAYRSVADRVNAVTHSITSQPRYIAAREGMTNFAKNSKEAASTLAKGLAQDPVYQATKNLMHSTKENIKSKAAATKEAIVTHPRYIAARDKAHAAATAVKGKISDASKRIFGEKTNEIDTSEFDLRMHQRQDA